MFQPNYRQKWDGRSSLTKLNTCNHSQIVSFWLRNSDFYLPPHLYRQFPLMRTISQFMNENSALACLSQLQIQFHHTRNWAIITLYVNRPTGTRWNCKRKYAGAQTNPIMMNKWNGTWCAHQIVATTATWYLNSSKSGGYVYRDISVSNFCYSETTLYPSTLLICVTQLHTASYWLADAIRVCVWYLKLKSSASSRTIYGYKKACIRL